MSDPYEEISIQLRDPEHQGNLMLQHEAADAIDELRYQVLYLTNINTVQSNAIRKLRKLAKEKRGIRRLLREE